MRLGLHNLQTKLTDLLIAESQNLFFSEHGRCGAATRHSQRCVEGCVLHLAQSLNA